MEDHRAAAHMPVWAPLTGAVLVGVMTAAQARINGQLALRIDDAFTAAVISFGSGLVIVVVLSLVLPAGRRGTAALRRGLRGRTIPWWMLLGGVAGAVTVATQGLVVAVVGVSLFTVGFVAGQTVSGLLLDRMGFGPGGAVAVTMPRIAGGALALVAVGLSFSGDQIEAPAWMLVLPVLAGAGVAWQQGTNGRLRQRVGTPLTATLVSFIGGTIVLGVAAVGYSALAGPPVALPTAPGDAWLYAGGALGAAYIFLAAAIVAYTGVLLMALAAIVGQLVASVIIDLLWPAQAQPDLLRIVLVVVVALASVVVAAVPWRGRRRRRGR